MPKGLRLLLALCCALALLGLVLPYLPWHDSLARLGRWQQYISIALLALMAWAIPPRAFPLDALKPNASLLGIGLLLLLEPLLHFILLMWATRAADLSLLGLVLPPTSGHTAGFGSALLLTVVLAPLVEEWCFRGRLFNHVRAHLGPANAVTITALAFAVAHGSVIAALVALPTGLLLGCVRLAGRGLDACILVHASHNLLFLFITGFAAVSHLPLFLCVAGIWLCAIALGWQYFPHRRHQRGIMLRSSLLMALCFLLLHDARRLHDRLWLQAATYQLAHPRIPLHRVMYRIGPEQRQRILDDERRSLLARSLLDSPWDIPAWRLYPIIARLDSDALLLDIASDPERAQSAIAEMADINDNSIDITLLARRICRRHRDAFRFLAMERWWMLTQWFPIDDTRDELVDLLANTHGQLRTRLLAHISDAYGRDEPLRCLLELPAAAVTPRDRVWVFKHHIDPERLLRERFGNDPELARAWQLR